jgi:hypothetical protein
MTFLQSALLSPAIHRTLTAASFHRVFEEVHGYSTGKKKKKKNNHN